MHEYVINYFQVFCQQIPYYILSSENYTISYHKKEVVIIMNDPEMCEHVVK